MAWNGEVKRFESRMKLVCPRWEEVPEVRGARGYLGIWVEGLSPGEGSQADSLSEEVSVQAKPGPEREELLKPDSQGMSSGYAEETVASFGHQRGASSWCEVESPISCAFRMKHLAVPVPSTPHVSHSRMSNFVTGSYHPRSSIQMMRDKMTSKLPDFPPPALPPKYAPMFSMDDPFSSTNKLHSNYLRHLNLVPGFKPPRVYSMTETIPVRVTKAQDEAAKGQPMTPRQLGIRNPEDPTFSDVLHRRETGPILVGCPNPPHLPDPLRGGPPNPLGSSSWPERKPQPPPRPPRDL